MNPLQFAETHFHLKGQPITFEGRPYLPEIYQSLNVFGGDGGHRRMVLRASRQVEKTQFVANTIVYLAIRFPNTRTVCVFPRQDQAGVFSNSRLWPLIDQSPVVRRALIGQRGKKPNVMDLRFRNGTEVNLRAAYHSADPVRGLDADFLFVDEFQDIAAGNLPVLEECLSHSKHRVVVLTGTPKLSDNHLEAVFRESTACEWHVPCPECHRGVLLDERVLGPRGLICPECRAPLDPRSGDWVSRNPHATWGAGYWVNHPMVPWVDHDEILERQRTYNVVMFKNEVLGLPASLGDHVVTREELEACCTNRPMARTFRDFPEGARQQILAGIDWGGGGTSRTVVTIGTMGTDFQFGVHHFARFDAHEDPNVVLDAVAKLCKRFRVTLVAADGGGNGSVYNRLLWEKLEAPARGRFFAIWYSTVGQQPEQDGVLWKWTVDRSRTIGTLFGRVKKGTLAFPRAADCGTFLDEFACETAEYDDVQRAVKYTHPPNQQDDALHATNYALLLGTLAYHASQ